MWVNKVKAKARKLRDSMQATGGGPAEDPLTPTEEKVVEIVWSASIYGFTTSEYPQLGAPAEGLPSPDVPPTPSTPPLRRPTQPPSRDLTTSGPTRRRQYYRRPHASEPLTRTLENNNALFRDSMHAAAECIASAIRDSATMLCEVVRESTQAIVAAQQFVVVTDQQETTSRVDDLVHID